MRVTKRQLRRVIRESLSSRLLEARKKARDVKHPKTADVMDAIAASGGTLDADIGNPIYGSDEFMLILKADAGPMGLSPSARLKVLGEPRAFSNMEPHRGGKDPSDTKSSSTEQVMAAINASGVLTAHEGDGLGADEFTLVYGPGEASTDISVLRVTQGN